MTASRDSPGAQFLAELGISEATAKRWMRLSKIPEAVFDQAIAASFGRPEPITEAELLALDTRFETAARPLRHSEIRDNEAYRFDAITTRRITDYQKVAIPRFMVAAVFQRDRYACRYCGDDFDLSIDHVVPEVLGGTIAFANLVTACRPCNTRKGTRLLGPPGWPGWSGWELAA